MLKSVPEKNASLCRLSVVVALVIFILSISCHISKFSALNSLLNGITFAKNGCADEKVPLFYQILISASGVGKWALVLVERLSECMLMIMGTKDI